MTHATHADAKTLGYCNRGLRRWFEGRDCSFDDFRQHGLTVAWLRQQGDAMANKLADLVEQRESARG